MRNKYRIVSGILLMCIMISLFTGCQNKKEDVSNDNEKPAKGSTTDHVQENTDSTAFSYPVKTDKALTYWTGMDSDAAQVYSNYAQSPMYQEYFKKTGIKIEFTHPPQGQKREQFNLMLATNDLPDIMEYDFLQDYPGGPEKAIKSGQIIALNDVIDKYAPNLKKYLKEHPEIDKMSKTDSGKYYAFPKSYAEGYPLSGNGLIIRKDWLDELGMEVPETIDEWHDVLTAFKEKKGAVAPFTTEDGFFKKGAVFMGAYGVGFRKMFYKMDGEVAYGPYEPNYKKALETLHQWYVEGLIDPDIATVDKKQAGSKMTNGQSGASLGYYDTRMYNWQVAGEKADPNYHLVPAPYPVLNKGDRCMFGNLSFPAGGNPGDAVITGKCENVELAARFLDYAFSQEGHMLMNFGVEGLSYTMKDGKPVWTDLILNNPDGFTANQTVPIYTRAGGSAPMIHDYRCWEESSGIPMTQEMQDALKLWSDTDMKEYLLPPVTPTADESEEYAAIMAEVDTYVLEMFFKFIIGVESLDNFDAYRETLKDMGIERVLDIQKQALERYNNR